MLMSSGGTHAWTELHPIQHRPCAEPRGAAVLEQSTALTCRCLHKLSGSFFKSVLCFVCLSLNLVKDCFRTVLL